MRFNTSYGFAIAACILAFARAADGGAKLELYPTGGVGVDCNIRDELPGLVTIAVVITSDEGVSAVSFAAPLPECTSGATWLADGAHYGSYVGDTQSGVTVNLSECAVGYFKPVLNISLFMQGSSSPCCVFIPQPHPDSDSEKIQYTDCGSTVLPAGAGAALFNASVCSCGYVVHPRVTNIDPPDGATGVSTSTLLDWDTYNPEQGVDLHYLDINTAPVSSTWHGSFSESHFDPGPLLPNTQYFWRVSIYWANNLPPTEWWTFTTGDGTTTVRESSWGAIKQMFAQDASF